MSLCHYLHVTVVWLNTLIISRGTVHKLFFTWSKYFPRKHYGNNSLKHFSFGNQKEYFCWKCTQCLIQTLLHTLLLADESSFLINSASKNIYSCIYMSTCIISIILPKYDLLLRDNSGFRSGYFSSKAERSEEWTSPHRRLYCQQLWPRTVSHGDSAGEHRRETGSGENGLRLTTGALREIRWCYERMFWL